MALKETYLAMKRRLGAEHPGAEFVVVTRTAHSVLAPSKELLADFKERYDALLAEGLGDIEAHNRAWDEVDYERRFRGEILKNPAAVAELGRIKGLSMTKDVYLVCYEKPPKKCHRHILVGLIGEMGGSGENRAGGILRRAGYGAGSEPAKAGADRKPFYIVCGRCGNPYRVTVAEREWIRGECPRCGNPIHVMRHKDRLFEKANGEWKPMVAEPIWGVAA